MFSQKAILSSGLGWIRVQYEAFLRTLSGQECSRSGDAHAGRVGLLLPSWSIGRATTKPPTSHPPNHPGETTPRGHLADVAENCGNKTRPLDWLYQVFVTTGIYTFCYILRAVSRPREYWYRTVSVGFRLPLANGARGFQSAHHRHLQIHQDEIGVVSNYFIKGDQAISGLIKFKVAIAQTDSNQCYAVWIII